MPRGSRTAIAVVLVVVAAAAAYAVTARHAHPGRSAPPAPTAVALTRTVVVPGTTPRLPWPKTGQAALIVPGIGDLGRSGPATAVPVASVAKVMTAYLVLIDHPLAAGASGPSLTVLPAEAAAYPHQHALDESLIRVTAGEQLTERQALEALLLPSADNIALILARWDAGSVAAFRAKMAATAGALGMADTRYTDPSGLDPSTVSTGPDQLILAQKAMALPAFAQIVAMRTASLPLAGTVANRNVLLGEAGVVGIKTGSTGEAGGCLVFAAHATAAGQSITVVGAVLGQRAATTDAELRQAFTASRTLIAAAARVVRPVVVVHAGDVVATGGGRTLVAGSDVTVLGWPGLPVRLTVTASVPAGAAPATAVGTVTAGTVTVPVTVS
jgi:serine-type D-Ala-D-Ala carboxypeptidase (penicillin-binding protein 5/6)